MPASWVSQVHSHTRRARGQNDAALSTNLFQTPAVKLDTDQVSLYLWVWIYVRIDKDVRIREQEMVVRSVTRRFSAVFSVFFLLLTGASTALADQVTLSYVDADSNAQTITLDCNTSTADLALAASLAGEDGTGLAYDADGGCGSLAELAAAMAAAAPAYAASVAQSLSLLSPDNALAIVDAVNAVPGVNAVAVRAAVHFGPPEMIVGPQSIGSDSAVSLDLMQEERIPSGN